MNLWTMIFLIVTVAVAAEMVKTIVKASTGSSEAKSLGKIKAQLGELSDRINKLDERLKNVETITTSKDFHLEREFEDLSKNR